jgi:hypothetical protein
MAVLQSHIDSGRDHSTAMTDDWFDIIEALLDSGARFLVVGAHALAVYGVVRGTQDLDLWIDPRLENASRVRNALDRFGAPVDTLGITMEDLTREGIVIQFGLPPNRIDLLTSISGVDSFAEAWADREVHAIRSREVPFLGRTSLVATKRATGRTKDFADLEALGE